MSESAKRSAATAKRDRPPAIPQNLAFKYEGSRKFDTLPTPPASASTPVPNRVRGTSPSPATLLSIQTKIRVYSTDKSTDHPKPRLYLDFVNVNCVKKPSSSNKSTKSPETVPSTSITNPNNPRKPHKVPVPVRVEQTKIGQRAPPKQGVPSSSSSPISPTFHHTFDTNIENQTESKANTDFEFSSSPTELELSFSFEMDEDGTADIIPHNSTLLLLGDSARRGRAEPEPQPEQRTQERTVQLRSPLKRMASHKQNRSGGFFIHSPETGTFEPVMLTPGRSG